MKSEEQYEHENAMMFARLEELAGKVEGRIAKVRSSEQKLKGLEFELKKITEERDDLKKRLQFLKKHKIEEGIKAEEIDVLTAQNFTIRNKIAKIVSDIDGQEISEDGVRELIETLISEIDDCIGLLK